MFASSALFHIKLCSFSWWGQKYFLPWHAGYLSYATVALETFLIRPT